MVLSPCKYRSQNDYTGSIMTSRNIYKPYLEYQSEFDHRWACWANNHKGWAKMKKYNKKLAKKRLRRATIKEYYDK